MFAISIEWEIELTTSWSYFDFVSSQRSSQLFVLIHQMCQYLFDVFLFFEVIRT